MAKEKLAAFNAQCTFQVHCGIQNQVSDKSKNVRSRFLRKYVVVVVHSIGCTFWASTIKFYAKASPSQHYQFEFLTLPSPVQHPEKFLFTIL